MGNFTKISPEGDILTGADSNVSRILETNPEDYKRWKAWNTSNFGSLRRAANEIKDDLDIIAKSVFNLHTADIPKALVDQISRIHADAEAVKTNSPKFDLTNEQDVFNDLLAKLPNITTRF